MYPVGFVIMLNESLRQQYLWTTSLYLFVQAICSAIFLFEASGNKKSLPVVILIFIVSIIIETIGVITGFPFGNYMYTDTLQPILFSTVPMAIGFAWVTLSVNSFLCVRYFLGENKNTLVVLLSGAFIALIDVILEPFASFINKYWLWENGDIPFQNYLSWFIIGILFSYILNKITGRFKINVFFPIAVLVLMVLQFLVINLVNNYLLISLTGIIGIVLITSSLIYLRKNEE